MRSVIKFMQVLGLWKQPYQSRSSIKPLIYVISHVFCLVLPGIIFIFRKQTTFPTVVRTSIESISVSNTMLLVVSTVINQPVLEKAYNDIREALRASTMDSSDKAVQVRIDSLESSTNRFFRAYIGFQTTIGLIYSLSNPVMTITQYIRTGELPALHGILEADFYIFDFTSNFWMWLVVVTVSGLSLFSVVIVIVSINSLNWSLIFHVAELFKVVCHKLSRLNTLSNREVQVKELINIIKLHEVTYRSARYLEKGLNAYMLIQFGTCIIMLCMTLMTLMLAIDDHDLLLKMIMMMVYIFLHNMAYSMLGSELTSASEAVADAVYNIPWYQYPVTEQRKLLFVLSRSQRITALTTGKFFNINRATFGMTLRSAISYFTVLMQMYDSQ